MTASSRGTVVVTGASAGIGAEIARVFGEAGYDLVLVARRAADLEKLGADIARDCGVECRAIPEDLLDPAAPRRLFDALQGTPVQILVNNAGMLFDGNFVDIGYDDHQRLLNLNINALVGLTHLFLGPMIEQASGRIVNISSTSAFQPVPSLAVYAASKAFVLSFTESLSEELRDSGVGATAICPGVTQTDMVAGVDDGTLAKVPNSLIMTPRKVAEEVLRACERGRVVHVNGPLNRVAAGFIKYQPRWLVRKIVGQMARD